MIKWIAVAVHARQRLERGTIVLRQQAVRNMQAIVRIHADQMRVERGV
jgi:hypothetical protein